LIWVSLLLVLLLGAAFSAARAALVNARKSRLHQMAERGTPGAARAERVAENSSRLLATAQVGRMLSHGLALAIATTALLPDLSAWFSQWPVLQPYAVALGILIIGLAGGIVLLVFIDLAPAILAARRAEAIALLVALPMDWLSVLFNPLVYLVTHTAGLITVPTGGSGSMPFVTEEEIKTLVDAGEEKGEIELDEKEMIYSVFEFGDKIAREVMIPRVDVLALSVSTPPAEAADAIIASGHSRVPVYEDGIDNIVGLLYAKDVLRVLRQGDAAGGSLRSLLRPAYFVPEAKKIDDLLRELQVKRLQVAVVVDEYGGVAGLITVEDILEELVGELQDEYDEGEEPVLQQTGPDEYVFAGRASLDDVAEALGVQLDPESGDTLGGFVYGHLGKVPAAGEKLSANGLDMEVLSVNRRRIEKVRVRRVAGPREEPQTTE
jgi:putative hemolysin